MVVLALLAGLAGVAPMARAADATHAVVPGERLEGVVDEAAGEALLRFRGRPVLAYAFKSDQFKPYVRDLHTLRGENVLRDAPADHLHHHGLMYAIRVNGVNFWEERMPAGRQVGRSAPRLRFGSTREGLPQATLRHALLWQAPGQESAREALLREERELVVTIDARVEEVRLEWNAAFSVGPRQERITLSGANYNGLGMRLPADFDLVATFLNSAGAPYSAAQSGDVTAATWSAALGSVGGREVLVAMGAAPGNPGQSRFFTMRQAFAYLSATQNLDVQPIPYAGGGAWRLGYLVLVYPAHQNADFLKGRFESWSASRPASR